MGRITLTILLISAFLQHVLSHCSNYIWWYSYSFSSSQLLLALNITSASPLLQYSIIVTLHSSPVLLIIISCLHQCIIMAHLSITSVYVICKPCNQQTWYLRKWLSRKFPIIWHGPLTDWNFLYQMSWSWLLFRNVPYNNGYSYANVSARFSETSQTVAEKNNWRPWKSVFQRTETAVHPKPAWNALKRNVS